MKSGVYGVTIPSAIRVTPLSGIKNVLLLGPPPSPDGGSWQGQGSLLSHQDMVALSV